MKRTKLLFNRATAQLHKAAGRLYKSVWLFPVLLAVPLIVLTVAGISGSSIGKYHSIFYGDTKDQNLLLNEPRDIRGDEWLVMSQLIIGQKENNYEKFNSNIGNGQDMSLILDMPNRDWSIFFKPQHLLFFVIPFDNAFAFRWWVMAYLLVLACYFFVLALLPKKRLLASMLAIGFLFTPFIQWWYQYITLGSLYYSLFAATAFIHLLNATKRKNQLLWGALLAYILTCFAIILYPPFQISCALVIGALCAGLLAKKIQSSSFKEVRGRVGIAGLACLVAVLMAGLFLVTRLDAVKTMAATAYPGSRSIESGGFNYAFLLSGHLDYQLQSNERAAAYEAAPNQSESSNFVMLMPYLLIPSIFLMVRQYKKTRKLDWPIVATVSLFLLFLVRLFVPNTDMLFTLLGLEPVPLSRMLIGFGLLSLIFTVLFIRQVQAEKANIARHSYIVLYAVIVFAFCLYLSLHAHWAFPGFIGIPKAIAFSLPIPIIVYLLLTKRFRMAAAILLAFLFASTAQVHPLYKGTAVVTDSPLSQAIRRISSQNDGRWVTETSTFEHFAVMNGARSLGGVHNYPQLELWKDSGADEELYNRYAHIYLLLDHEQDTTTPTRLALPAPDTLIIVTEPCSSLLYEKEVRFIIAESPVPDDCLTLQETVKFPVRNLYIYRIDRANN